MKSTAHHTVYYYGKEGNYKQPKSQTPWPDSAGRIGTGDGPTTLPNLKLKHEVAEE